MTMLPECPSAYSPKARRWLPTAAVALALLYALTINDSWAIRPDSGVYLSLGRSLAEGRGMEYNGRQVWGVPLLVPALAAGCRLVAGGEHLWLLNAVMGLFGFGTALAAMGLANRLAEDRAQQQRMQLAAGALLLVGVSARLFGDSLFILTDVPFTFLFTLGLYGYARGRTGHWAWCLVGAAAMLAATYTRLVTLALLPAVVLAMVLPPRRPGYWKRLLATLGGAAAVGAGFAYWMLVLRARSDPASADYFNVFETHVLAIHAPDRWARMAREVLRIPEAVAGTLLDQKLPWLNLVPTAVILVGLATAAARRQWLAVLPVLVYLAFLAAWGNGAIAARYLLPVMPLLAYALLAGTQTIATGAALAARRVTVWWSHVAVVILVIACVAVSLPKDLRDIYRSRHPRFYDVYAHGQWRGTVEVSRALRERGRPETDEVGTPEASVVHYLSGLRVMLRPLGPKQGMWSPAEIPPKAFAEAVAGSDFRFLVIPMDKEGWSPEALREVEATGAFRPPEYFGTAGGIPDGRDGETALLERAR